MKLCKLKLKNLNSFRGETELDFERPPLDEASLVAITGPTGAGKTTLLDAICVALYGKTPRLAGTGTQHPSHLLRHGETDCHAEVHFEANGVRYLAEWSLRRNGTPKGQLLFAENDELITDRLSTKGKSLGVSENTISEEINAILGLDFDAFKRSVMLAQGEFAAFLKADLKSRREILEKTAGIGIYNRINDKLNAKESEASDAHKLLDLELSAVSEVSREQITAAEVELGALQASSNALSAKNDKIQKKKDEEKKRAEDSEKLQASKKRQDALLNQQPMIESLEIEWERADRANRLLPEKQAFDSAKSDLGTADAALRQAKIELTDAKKQFDERQADFNEKEEAYQGAQASRDQKIEVYRGAKADAARAQTQFELVEEKESRLQQLEDKIDALSTELADKHQEQTALEEDIDKAETFLEENPLPSDRQSRLTQAKELLVELRSLQEQRLNRLNSQSEHTLEIERLEKTLKELTENREELLEDKENIETALAKADTKLRELRATGDLEDWQNLREKARGASPIAQRYEVAHEQLCNAEGNAAELQKNIIELDESLNDVNRKLEIQTQLCKRADAKVARLEAERELTLLTNPINQLRRQLEPGRPCRVCGATEHPCADEVEHESEAQLEIAQSALDAADTDARDAQEQHRHLEQEQARLQQSRINITTQIDAFRKEIEHLKDEIETAQSQWRARYETADISSEWLNEQISTADNAINNLGNAHSAHIQASNELNLVSEKLTTCERDITRENNQLDDNQRKLAQVTTEIENLNKDIEDSQTRSWALLPESFHRIDLENAVNQFGNTIENVAAYEQARDEKQNQLTKCNNSIGEKERSLETERGNHRELGIEIEGYRNEGNSFLKAAREKTDGLATGEEIDAAIESLDAMVKSQADRRDEANQKLQESRDQRTAKQANHQNCQDRQAECSDNFETARTTYLDKLSSEEFDSSQEHDDAFRTDSEMEQLRKKIDDYAQKKRMLEEEIARLAVIFEKNPFKPQILDEITAKATEIGEHIKETQQKIGEQRRRIEELLEAFSKREALDDKIQEAAKELNRWTNLKSIIGENRLFNFASNIILGQVNRLANDQLDFLSSGRYQLKAEDIDEKLRLTIVDRWNANEERPVETLSGGESFLTSLALALALSELSRGRAQIHSLFLDEGFGTLDSETLDVAIAALEGLQMRGRSIFLISHVGELTRRIPVQIAVKKMGNGSSQVQIRG